MWKTNHHRHNICIVRALIPFIFPAVPIGALRPPTSFEQNNSQDPLCALKEHNRLSPFKEFGESL